MQHWTSARPESRFARQLHRPSCNERPGLRTTARAPNAAPAVHCQAVRYAFSGWYADKYTLVVKAAIRVDIVSVYFSGRRVGEIESAIIWTQTQSIGHFDVFVNDLDRAVRIDEIQFARLLHACLAPVGCTGIESTCMIREDIVEIERFVFMRC